MRRSGGRRARVAPTTPTSTATATTAGSRTHHRVTANVDDVASDVESGAGHARGDGEPLGPGPGVGELGQRQRAGVGQHPEQAHREHGVRHAEAHQPDARGPADGPAPAQADPDQRAENARADGGGGGSQPAAEEGDAARGQHRDRADPRSTAVTDDGEGEGRQQDTDPARRHQPREHGDGRDQVSQGRCLGDLRHRERPSAAPVRPRHRHPGHMAHHRPGGLRPAQGSPTADGQVYDARADPGAPRPARGRHRVAGTPQDGHRA